MMALHTKTTLAALALVCAAGVRGQTGQAPAAAEADALDLADKAQDAPPEPASPLRMFLELAVGQGAERSGSAAGMGRAAVDLRYAGALSLHWRAVLSARLDMVRGRGAVVEEDNATWREAYLSWTSGPELTVDLGRVNLRHGVAIGFNPTDWFKQSSVRTVLNLDPAVLRENRQGTVVVQGHRYWKGASLSVAVSPKLTSGGNNGTFSPRLGATNPEDRWLIAGSLQWREGLTPQVLLHGGSSTPIQLGANLTALVSESVVAHIEFSTGDGTSLVDRARGVTSARTRQDRLAAGFTYTTPYDLSLTAEWQSNSAAPTRTQWQGLDAATRGVLLGVANDLQDLPVRRQLFIYAQWKPPAWRGFEVNGFFQRDLSTFSAAGWVEGRYRIAQTDIALQFQAFGGSAGSVYRAVPQQRAWQVILRHYL